MSEARRSSVLCPWCKSQEATVSDGIYRCPRCGYERDITSPPEIEVIGWTDISDSDYPEIICKSSAVYDAILRDVKERGLRFGLGEHQSSDCPGAPVINNGFKVSCGTRTWGEIMSIANHGDASQETLYYIGLSYDPVFPERGVDRDRIVPFEIE
jgi:hypothetical protein